MQPDEIDMIINDLEAYNAKFPLEQRTRRFHFSGHKGEPLVSPATLHGLQRLQAAGYETGIITNGRLMKPEARAILLGNTFVYVSVYGWSKDSYDSGAGLSEGVAFFQMRDNLRALLEERRLMNSRTEINVGVLLHRRIYREVGRIARDLKAMGIDSVRFKPPMETDEGALTAAEWAECYAMIRQLKAELDSEQFKLYVMFSEQKAGGLTKNKFTRCLAHPMIAVVGPNLNVYPCAHTCGFGMPSFGDLHEESFEQIWSGPRRFAMMSRMVPERDCPVCPHQAGLLNRYLESAVMDPRYAKEGGTNAAVIAEGWTDVRTLKNPEAALLKGMKIFHGKPVGQGEAEQGLGEATVLGRDGDIVWIDLDHEHENQKVFRINWRSSLVFIRTEGGAKMNSMDQSAGAASDGDVVSIEEKGPMSAAPAEIIQIALDQRIALSVLQKAWTTLRPLEQRVVALAFPPVGIDPLSWDGVADELVKGGFPLYNVGYLKQVKTAALRKLLPGYKPDRKILRKRRCHEEQPLTKIFQTLSERKRQGQGITYKELVGAGLKPLYQKLIMTFGSWPAAMKALAGWEKAQGLSSGFVGDPAKAVCRKTPSLREKGFSRFRALSQYSDEESLRFSLSEQEREQMTHPQDERILMSVKALSQEVQPGEAVSVADIFVKAELTRMEFDARLRGNAFVREQVRLLKEGRKRKSGTQRQRSDDLFMKAVDEFLEEERRFITRDQIAARAGYPISRLLVREHRNPSLRRFIRDAVLTIETDVRIIDALSELIGREKALTYTLIGRHIGADRTTVRLRIGHNPMVGCAWKAFSIDDLRERFCFALGRMEEAQRMGLRFRWFHFSEWSLISRRQIRELLRKEPGLRDRVLKLMDGRAANRQGPGSGVQTNAAVLASSLENFVEERGREAQETLKRISDRSGNSNRGTRIAWLKIFLRVTDQSDRAVTVQRRAVERNESRRLAGQRPARVGSVVHVSSSHHQDPNLDVWRAYFEGKLAMAEADRMGKTAQDYLEEFAGQLNDQTNEAWQRFRRSLEENPDRYDGVWSKVLEYAVTTHSAQQSSGLEPLRSEPMPLSVHPFEDQETLRSISPFNVDLRPSQDLPSLPVLPGSLFFYMAPMTYSGRRRGTAEICEFLTVHFGISSHRRRPTLGMASFDFGNRASWFGVAILRVALIYKLIIQNFFL